MTINTVLRLSLAMKRLPEIEEAESDLRMLCSQVLLGTLIIHQILGEREKRSMLRKLNMVIGAFFSEVGTPLLSYFRLGGWSP